jgi:hypothetical protein
MPRKYPSYQTCHRRFKAWHESGVMQRVMTELYGESSRELFELMEQRMRSNHAAEVKAAEGVDGVEEVAAQVEVQLAAAQPATHAVAHAEAHAAVPRTTEHQRREAETAETAEAAEPAEAAEALEAFTLADVFKRAA